MFNTQHFRRIVQQIQVIRTPRHRLATFGTSKISYQLVSDVPGFKDRSRLRTGLVVADKPAIITSQTLKDQFQGFGDEIPGFLDALIQQYGQAIRGLDYQFKNEPLASRIDLTPPNKLILELAKDHDSSGGFNNTLIQGPDKFWQLAIMKFVLEETMTSFSSNLQELQDRGYFEADNRTANRQQREIQQLLKQAETNRSLVPVLGKKLKEYGLFEEYQDAFFGLLNK